MAQPRELAGADERAPALSRESQMAGGLSRPRNAAKPLREYLSEKWRDIVELNRIREFSGFWNAAGGWVEPVNKRRGGWSGVSRIELRLPDGGRRGVFIKRQQGHYCRLPGNPMVRVPTSLREYLNLRRCRALGIPTPELIYFGYGGKGTNGRSILATAELENYRPLSDWNREWAGLPGRQGFLLRRRVLKALGRLIRRLHDCRLQHHALKTSNIFLRIDADGSFDLRLLDLEMMRWHPWPAQRDLLTLHRKAIGWSAADRLAFLLAYCGENRVGPSTRKLWLQLARRDRRKQAREA